jgi:hypothetical protein
VNFAGGAVISSDFRTAKSAVFGVRAGAALCGSSAGGPISSRRIMSTFLDARRNTKTMTVTTMTVAAEPPRV